MKKLLTVAITTALAFGLAGCGSSSEGAKDASGNELITVKVGASPSPHAKILNYLETSGEAAKAGLKIEVKEFSDYVLPNTSLAGGDLDANYFQTTPYLDDQKKQNPDFADFNGGKGIHLEPLALFSEKIKAASELTDGATIGIINDPTNQERGLRLLESQGLIKLPADGTINVAAIKDSAEFNPKKFVFKEVEGPQLVRTLGDVDAAVINGNFAQAGGLEIANAVAVESPENNPAVNILVWKGEASEGVKKLETLLHSEAVKKFIEETWPDKSVIPAF